MPASAVGVTAPSADAAVVRPPPAVTFPMVMSTKVAGSSSFEPTLAVTSRSSLAIDTLTPTPLPSPSTTAPAMGIRYVESAAVTATGPIDRTTALFPEAAGPWMAASVTCGEESASR